ncbi:MAG: galactokinase [Sphaerochaetaceae bacterium]|nr:galactokinase [Sphaerochaetaceae bacterium]
MLSEKFLQDRHREVFKTEPEALFSAAGRTELGGNHTDHNKGCILAASIDLSTMAAVSLKSEPVVEFYSEGYRPFSVDLSDTRPVGSEKGNTKALVRGVAAAILKRGGKIGGMRVNVCSEVPSGKGLSSSASVEVLIACIFNELYNGGRFSTTELAQISQEAENIHFGKPCGLMDQIACANGNVVYVSFYPELEVKTVDSPFEDWGLSIVLVDTHSSHENLTPQYAAIREEMESVAACFGKKVLAQVSEEEFLQNIKKVRQRLKNDRAVLRAIHFFEETKRARLMFEALGRRDKNQYLKLTRECGLSSSRYLQNIYPDDEPYSQGVNYAISIAELLVGEEGAVRVHGGGFGGTIQVLLPLEKVDFFVEEMEKKLEKGCCTVIKVRKEPVRRVL